MNLYDKVLYLKNKDAKQLAVREQWGSLERLMKGDSIDSPFRDGYHDSLYRHIVVPLLYSNYNGITKILNEHNGFLLNEGVYATDDTLKANIFSDLYFYDYDNNGKIIRNKKRGVSFKSDQKDIESTLEWLSYLWKYIRFHEFIKQNRREAELYKEKVGHCLGLANMRLWLNSHSTCSFDSFEFITSPFSVNGGFYVDSVHHTLVKVGGFDFSKFDSCGYTQKQMIFFDFLSFYVSSILIEFQNNESVWMLYPAVYLAYCYDNEVPSVYLETKKALECKLDVYLRRGNNDVKFSDFYSDFLSLYKDNASRKITDIAREILEKYELK